VKVPKGYQVINVDTGDVKSRKTTKEKAEKQIRLLNAIEHGFVPKKR
jgi:hypothetical protein